MLTKVSGGLSITGVKVTTHETAITLTLAVFSTTLEDMNTPVFDIFDGRGGFEEYIYG